MTTTPDEEIRRLCKELAFKGIRLTPTNSWLVACVNCFRDEVKSPGQYTPSDLFQFVLEQWLLADLKDVASPCFPSASTIATAPHIAGRFAVQLNYAVNIAVSCHRQHQKMCRPEVQTNLDIESDGKRERESTDARAFKLELTDGIITVIAFEDKPIACLENPTPGEKLLLKGKIEVRKGILMLNGGNVESLGGEVDTLLVPNATVNILARKLGLPENPQPYANMTPRDGSENLNGGTTMFVGPENSEYDEDELLRHVELLESQIMSRQPSVSSSGSSSNRANHEPLSAASNPRRPAPSYASSNSRPSTSNHHPSTSFKPPTPATLESQHNRSTESRTSNLTKPPTTPNFDFGDDFDDIDVDAVNSVMNKIESPQNVIKIPVSQDKLFSQFDDDDDIIFTSNHLENSFKLPDRSATIAVTNQTSLPTEDWPPKTFPCERQVDAEVTGLTSKLKLSGGQFRLTGKIKCQGHEFEVNFSPQVLDKVFYLTAAEVIEKKCVALKNELVKHQLNDQLKMSQEKISTLRAKMTVKFVSEASTPNVIDVIN